MPIIVPHTPSSSPHSRSDLFLVWQDMTLELLRHVDGSVVVVDWRSGSGPPYPQAVANIRLIGAMTAHLLRDLIVSVTTSHLQTRS